MQKREFHIDLLKILASQLIVLHHFSAYGPLSLAMDGASPGVSDWLYDDARMAVQVFLVLGGFLAARSLTPQPGTQMTAPWRLVWQRYWRLMPAFAMALLFTMASSVLARHWLVADFIPGVPTWQEFLAHITLTNGVLDVESLSAGVWYVAIDFQLFALMVLLLWGTRSWAKVGVAGLMLLSLFYFNRNAHYDDWAVYFFGAYGLGAMAYWCHQSKHGLTWLIVMACVTVAALAVDFRARLVVALFTALLLGLAQWHARGGKHITLSPFWSGTLKQLSNSSYALFLVHFSVLMLANALFSQLSLNTPGAAALLLLAAWLTCMGLAMLFVQWVERPLSRLGPSLIRTNPT